jgi:hypothetical protein
MKKQNIEYLKHLNALICDLPNLLWTFFAIHSLPLLFRCVSGDPTTARVLL